MTTLPPINQRRKSQASDQRRITPSSQSSIPHRGTHGVTELINTNLQRNVPRKSGVSDSRSPSNYVQPSEKKGKIELEHQDEKDIMQMQMENALDRTQFDTTEEYINKLRFSIELDSLYKVYDSVSSNTESRFCPVLVKIGKDFIDDQRFDYTYLLQVWSRAGKLIFERTLQKPLANWNIHGSYFVFQEQNDTDHSGQIHLLELSEINECLLYTFNLPHSAFDGQAHAEHSLLNTLDKFGKHLNKRMNTELPSKEKVFRDPKKIQRRIGIAKNNLLVMKDKQIYYISLDDVKTQTQRTLQQNMSFFTIEDGCNLMDIMDIGNEETVLTLINKELKLCFYQIKDFGQFDTQGNRIDVQLVKLGLVDHDIKKKFIKNKNGVKVPYEEKPLAQPVLMRSIVMLDQKKIYKSAKPSEGEQKFTSSQVVVREDGSFEFYSDFNLVSSSRNEQEDLFCSRIEVDNESYYLLINKASEQDLYTLYEFPLSWGNLLGMSIATKVHKANIRAMEEGAFAKMERGNKKLNEVKAKQAVSKDFNEQIDSRMLQASHRRVSPYFRIFTQFFNYGTCMLVAHREYVSVFDLKSEGKVDIHIKYDDQVILLADSTIKYEYQTQRTEEATQPEKNISVLLGNNQVYHIKETDGVIEQTSEPQAMIENRIINFCTDQSKDTAIYILTKSDQYVYTTFREDDINRFRMAEPQSLSSDFQLIALRGTNISVLGDSNTMYLTDDTTIKVFYKGLTEETLECSLMVSANQHGYSIPIKPIDPVTQMVEADSNNILDYTSTLMARNEDDKATQELIDKLGMDYLPGKLIGCVRCEEVDHHARLGYLAQITTQGIEVYDQNQKLVEWYTNPNIKEMVLVDETYLYCLCEAYNDPIKKYDLKKQIVSRPRGASISNQPKGLYVYDIQRLLKDGYVECYNLAPAVVGMAHQLDFSGSSGRLSYFTSFKEMSMLPFPHRNTINFLGMGDKSEYLIWREKDGFFTGLHKSGQLRVWSIGSGKFIGIKSLTDMAEKKRNTKVKVKTVNEDYEIYQAHDEDTCWTRGFQNKSGHSIQLLKKKQPEHLADRNDKIDNKNFKSTANNSVETIIQEQETFEFLVLKMTTCSDKYKKKWDREENIRKSDKDKSLQVKVIMRFMFPLPKEGKRPTLHLSKDLKKMMEVVDRQVAVIHKIDHQEETGVTEWKKKHLISQYPTLLQGTSTLPFLFCPNFERYIDVDFAKGNFVVRNTNSLKKEVIEIPKSLLGLSVVTESDEPETNQQDEDDVMVKKQLVIQNEESIAFLAKRMHFCKREIIRIINTEGIDTYYDLRNMQIVAYAKHDNLAVMSKDMKDQKHFILEKQQYEVDDLMSRLVHRSSTYKANIEYTKYELKYRQALQKSYRKPNLLQFLYKVEYTQNNFVAEASFTLLDWIICDRIQTDSLFDFNDIDRKQQIQLCFNIFPKAQTILHKLALASELSNESSESTESIGTIAQKLFSVCKKGLGSEQASFELPIVEDLRGHTVLDIALTRHDQYKYMGMTQRFWDFWNLIFGVEDTIFKRKENLFLRVPKYVLQVLRPPAVQMPMLNSQLAMTIFANITSYGYLHSSCIIYPAVIEAIRIGLPNIGEYLDSRLVISQHLPNRTQHDLKRSHLEYWHTGDKYCDEEDKGDEDKWLCQQYNTVNAQLWEKKTTLESALFKKTGVHKNMIIRYLDVPSLHTRSDEGVKFIKAMRNLSNIAQEIQLNIYSKRSVQIIVNEHWRRTYGYIIAFLFIPYVVMLTVYSLWSNFTIQGQKGWAASADATFSMILFCMSIYFLMFEVIQFFTNPLGYLMEGWSYIKTIPMMLVLYNTSFSLDTENLNFWYRQSFAGFFMWFRLLYFMRSIEHFSYFIRMLLFVMWKIKIFLIILTIAVLGFADTFYSLSTSTKYMPTPEADPTTGVVPDAPPAYISSYVNSLQYSYEIVIGQFADELDSQDSLSWFFFVLASILSMLILANLLIEIVSETYGEVTAKKYLYVFKERVDLICDWQSDLQVIEAIKYCLYMSIKPFIWCLRKCEFIKRNRLEMKQEFKEMMQKCKMLMVAWEDPENKDETNDFVEDMNEETTDEKIETVQMQITDMKIQLGLEPDIMEEYDDSADRNPLQSIQAISDKLDKVVNALGLTFDNHGKAQVREIAQHELIGEVVPQQFTRQGTVLQQQTEPSGRLAGIKYKKDEVFDWQAMVKK